MYLIFGGDMFYAQGGAHDLLDQCVSLKQAEVKFQSLQESGKYDWIHIFSITSLEVIDSWVSPRYNR